MKGLSQPGHRYADEPRASVPSPRFRQVTRATWELVGVLDSLAATLSNAKTAAGHDWLRSLAVVATEMEYDLLRGAEARASTLIQECNELAELLRRAPLAPPHLGTPGRGTASRLEALRDRALATCLRLADLLSSDSAFAVFARN